MPNPQVENGFIRIATGDSENDVLSALVRARLSGVEYQIVLLVIRRTWGYGKKQDWISLSQFQEVTGSSRSYICRAIDQLVTRRILVTQKSPGQTHYGFNKTFSEWVVTPTSLVTPKSPLVTSTSRTSDVQDNQLVTPTSHTKEILTKETITKERDDGSPREPTPSQEANDFFENADTRERIIKAMMAKGLQEGFARTEVKKFCAYWTERTPSGQRQLWQTKKTFEIRRRLATWINNAPKFSPNSHAH